MTSIAKSLYLAWHPPTIMATAPLLPFQPPAVHTQCPISASRCHVTYQLKLLGKQVTGQVTNNIRRCKQRSVTNYCRLGPIHLVPWCPIKMHLTLTLSSGCLFIYGNQCVFFHLKILKETKSHLCNTSLRDNVKGFYLFKIFSFLPYFILKMIQ